MLSNKLHSYLDHNVGLGECLMLDLDVTVLILVFG